jgi:hypothetical protein
MAHVWGDDFRALMADRLYVEAMKLYRLSLFDLAVSDKGNYEKLRRRAEKWRITL